MSDNEEASNENAKGKSTSAPKLTAAPAITINNPNGGITTRANSPVNQLPSELLFKFASQRSRLDSINDLIEQIPNDAENITLSDVQVWATQLEELHKAFIKDHSIAEITWPSSMANHEYFAKSYQTSECKNYMTAKLKLGRLREILTPATSSSSTPIMRAAPSDTRYTKLPDIELQKFSGEYAKWPEFKGHFESLIKSDTRLREQDKFHYLRSCCMGSASQLIASLPFTDESMAVAWELLPNRFENKRHIIQEYLDMLYNMQPALPKHAASLNKILTTITEVTKALQLLGAGHNMWECVLVDMVQRNLDRPSRESWENSLGSTTNYPGLKDIETYLTSRVRTLERVEASSSSKPAASTKSKSTAAAHQVTLQIPQQKQHRSCDMCKENHFIVMCPKFRALDKGARKQVVVAKSLCYNCLGPHSARVCRSVHLCKECNGKHHTMLHDPSRPIPASTSTTGQSPQ